MDKRIGSDIPDPFEDLISAGKVEEKETIINPFSGEIIEIGKVKRTVYDSHRGEWEIMAISKPITASCGCVLTDPQLMMFCQWCGAEVCIKHGVTDEFCGMPLCLRCSKLVEYEGGQVRVCENCAKKIKRHNFWKKLKGIFGGG